MFFCFSAFHSTRFYGFSRQQYDLMGQTESFAAFQYSASDSPPESLEMELKPVSRSGLGAWFPFPVIPHQFLRKE